MSVPTWYVPSPKVIGAGVPTVVVVVEAVVDVVEEEVEEVVDVDEVVVDVDEVVVDDVGGGGSTGQPPGVPVRPLPPGAAPYARVAPLAVTMR